MFCENCGAQLPEGARFCESCGSPVAVAPQAEPPKQASDTVIPPVGGYAQSGEYNTNPQPDYAPLYAEPQPVQERPKSNVDPMDAIKDYINRYADFHGRTVRAGYWWPVLAVGILSTVLDSIPVLKWVGVLFSLATIIPSLAIGVRRLHDTGRSGKFMLLALIPLVGWIILIVLCIKQSAGDNQWGLAPEEFRQYPPQI